MTLRPEPYGHLVNDRTFSAIEAFRQKAEERGVAMATLAMAWVLSHPQTTAIIVEPRRPAHLELACNALEAQLTEAERNELTTLFSPNKTS